MRGCMHDDGDDASVKNKSICILLILLNFLSFRPHIYNMHILLGIGFSILIYFPVK